MRIPPEMHHDVLTEERSRCGRTWGVDPVISFCFWWPMVPLANTGNVQGK
jgi:hypothetical protein